MSRKRRQKRDRVEGHVFIDVEAALDIIDDDLPDGAYWALLEEMTGMEPAEIAEWIERREAKS